MPDTESPIEHGAVVVLIIMQRLEQTRHLWLQAWALGDFMYAPRAATDVGHPLLDLSQARCFSERSHGSGGLALVLAPPGPAAGFTDDPICMQALLAMREQISQTSPPMFLAPRRL